MRSLGHLGRPSVRYVSGWELNRNVYLMLIMQVFPLANVIFAGAGVLLSVCILLNTSMHSKLTFMIFRQRRTFGQAKTLVTIFERIEGFSRRLGNYTKILPSPEMINTIGKILVEVLSILAIVKKEIMQGQTSE